MFDLVRVRAFVEAANCLNFTTAAYRLFITPSSLSKYISQLEDQLGFSLFVRSNRTVSLTKAGEYLYKYFDNLLSDIDINIDRARSISEGKLRRLHIGLHGFTYILPNIGELMYAFSSSHPNFSFAYSLLSTQDLRSILLPSTFDNNPGIDAVLTKKYKVNHFIDCECKVISTCRLTLVARVGHPIFQEYEHPTLSDMKNYTFIGIAESFSPQVNHYFREICEKQYGFTPNITEHLLPNFSIFLHAMSSDDIAIVDETEAFPYNSLRAVPIDSFFKIETVLAYNKNTITDDLKVLLDFIDEYIDKQTNYNS